MHTLPGISYSYDALEPFIDAKTMEIHHSKHHQAYTDNFNKALKPFPELVAKTPEELLSNLKDIPEAIRDAVINYGGGYYNHSLFWQMMSPEKSEPSMELNEAITRKFGSLGQFKELFTQVASTYFGSGWVWLVKDKNGELDIISMENQETPVSEGRYPLLTIDVWEHAYYLKYQNKRPDYIRAWWNVVNWEFVNNLFVS